MKNFHRIIVVTCLLLTVINTNAQTKKVVKKYAGKSIKEKYYILKSTGEKHGAYTHYYRKSKLTEGNYEHGLKHGKWIYYNRSDEKFITGNYYRDERDGKWIYHGSQGKVKSINYYDKGKMDSIWTSYYPDGTLSYRQLYVNGMKQDTMKSYYENGKLHREIVYKDDLRHGVSRTYFESGQLHMELEYRDNKRYLLNVIKDLKGKDLDGGDFAEGNGTLKTYYKSSLDGAPEDYQIYSITEYQDGIANGPAIYYFDDGKIREKGDYKEGYRSGEWTWYRQNREENTTDYSEEGAAKVSKSHGDVGYSDEVFTIVEEMPEFPGGQNSLFAFLRENIKYPNSAKDAGIQGTVYVTFVVNEIGEVTEISILRGISGDCDREVIRIMNLMPRWIPGFQQGIPVKVQYNLPVKFSLR